MNYALGQAFETGGRPLRAPSPPIPAGAALARDIAAAMARSMTRPRTRSNSPDVARCLPQPGFRDRRHAAPARPPRRSSCWGCRAPARPSSSRFSPAIARWKPPWSCRCWVASSATCGQPSAGGQDAYPECLQSMDRSELAALGQRYLERAAAYRRTTRPFFVDKRPWNWRDIGLIAMILPRGQDHRHPPPATRRLLRHVQADADARCRLLK